MNAGVVILLGFLAVGAAGADFDNTSSGAGVSASYTTLADLAAGAGFPTRHQDDMVAIAMAESSGRLGVVSEPNSNGTRDRCAWQINDVHGFDRSRLVADPDYCAAAAYDVYVRQGREAWTVFNTGAYRQYLDDARRAVRS